MEEGASFVVDVGSTVIRMGPAGDDTPAICAPVLPPRYSSHPHLSFFYELNIILNILIYICIYLYLYIIIQCSCVQREVGQWVALWRGGDRRVLGRGRRRAAVGGEGPRAGLGPVRGPGAPRLPRLPGLIPPRRCIAPSPLASID